MNIYIDQEPYSLSSKSQRDIINEISSFIDEKGKVLDYIVLDNKEYYEFEAIDWENINSDIKIVTVTPIKMCLNTVRDTDSYIDRLVNAFEKIMAFYRDGKESEGTKLLGSAVSGIEWVNSVIIKIEPVLGLNYQKLEVKGQKIVDYYGNYSSKLNELTEAIEAKDNFLAADIIEYEIIPAFEGWKEFFENLLKAFESAN
jgi:hypothetical protein